MSKIAFIGLGVMGYPMAGHLAAAGHDVTVYNRTQAKAEAWAAQHGGHFAVTPAAAATGADFVFCCVGDDPDVLAVALGPDGAIPAMQDNAVFIDNSTVSAELAQQLSSAAKAYNVAVLDAPVSGGQAGAENAKLTVMVGGADAAFNAYSASTTTNGFWLFRLIKTTGSYLPELDSACSYDFHTFRLS